MAKVKVTVEGLKRVQDLKRQLKASQNETADYVQMVVRLRSGLDQTREIYMAMRDKLDSMAAAIERDAISKAERIAELEAVNHQLKCYVDTLISSLAREQRNAVPVFPPKAA